MGIAAGDYENNGNLSIVNTDFADDYNVLFQNDGTGNFTDVSSQAGIVQSSMPFVSFADGFLDYDNDGWRDLLIVNGHVYPEVDQHPEWGNSYAQRMLLYHNLKNGKFELVPAVEGTGLAVVTVGRGAAFGDIFNDGKIDVACCLKQKCYRRISRFSAPKSEVDRDKSFGRQDLSAGYLS